MAVVALAADATGKWTAEMQGRNGQTRQVNMDLKAVDGKLTGTVGGQQGETEISNGTISGDQISFDVVREFNGNQMKMHYTGTVSGDQISFKVKTIREGGEGRTAEFVAKRSTT
jgi:hypothetical protein